MNDHAASLPVPTASKPSDLLLAGRHAPSMQLMLNNELFERAKLIAKYLSEAEGFVPKNLLGKPAACFAVVSMAWSWHLDAYMVARCTYQTPGGQVGFFGSLCHAILENSGMLEGGVKFEFVGEWQRLVGKFVLKTSQKGNQYPAANWAQADEDGLGVIVSAKVRGEHEPRTFRFDLVQAFPRNSTLWATDPRTQLCYTAVRRFANLVAPALFMGVPFDIDDVEHFSRAERAKDVTPPRPSMGAPKAAEPEPEAEPEPAYELVDETGTVVLTAHTTADWIKDLLGYSAPNTNGQFSAQAFAYLENNRDATMAIVAECKDNDLVAKLQARYTQAEQAREEQETAGSGGAENGTTANHTAADPSPGAGAPAGQDVKPSQPAGAPTQSAQAGGAPETSPASQAADEASVTTANRETDAGSNAAKASPSAPPPAAEGPKPIELTMTQRGKVDSASYLVKIQEEMKLASQPEHIDMVLAREGLIQPRKYKNGSNLARVLDGTARTIEMFAARLKTQLGAP